MEVLIDWKNISVGDTLKMRDFDSDEIVFEEVTHISNPKIDDTLFQVRTEKYDYDLLNFFEILEVIKKAPDFR